jgi:probable HAF family extracellular repeat protein
MAINDNGEIVGLARTADGNRWRAVRWVPDGATYSIHDDIGTLGGPKAEARAINSRGQIVGRSLINNRAWRGFIWSPGAGIKELAPLSGDSESSASDINNAVPAQIAGVSTTSSGGARAVRWQLLQ